MWPRSERPTNAPPPPTLTEVVDTLDSLPKKELPAQLTAWLDGLADNIERDGDA